MLLNYFLLKGRIQTLDLLSPIDINTSHNGRLHPSLQLQIRNYPWKNFNFTRLMRKEDKAS